MNENTLSKSAQQMSQALFAFKDMVGNGGLSPAKNNIARLATSVEIKYLGYDCFKASHSLLKDRVDFVSYQADKYFEINAIKAPSYEPLANGGESLVLDCNNGYVLKIQTGKGYHAPKSDLILEPECKNYSEELNTSFAIYKKVNSYKSNIFDVTKMAFKLAREGIFMTDVNFYNFGYKEKMEKPILIDGGAAREFKSPLDLFSLGINIFIKPIYREMTFIHKPWRDLKKTMYEDFGIGSKPIIQPDILKLKK